MGTEPEPTPLPGRVASTPGQWTSQERTSILPATPGDAAPRAGSAPDRVGPYRILKELGRGGMGVVHLGVRDDLPQRYVAIKLVHRGMAVGEVLERFTRERAALASLNHPNIASLLDGGTSERGEPYFVMEYVEGRPIDEYCDARRLTITERLRLFQQVCAAVHHAHQHLVVHRDIKPRNILVTAEGDPKLLDFGIAKLLNPAIGIARDAPTETGLRVMTPEYASPEQIRGEPITTVSDVYSLGVVLFELLTGRRPYRLKTRMWKELERVICEEDPQRPSTAVTRVEALLGDAPGSGEQEGDSSSRSGGERTPELIGLARGERPLRLRRTLAGDLDNIVLKALRKEPQRRYASAEQFSEDIQRHLDGKPVTARPDTFIYRASKFVHRNRGGVLAAGFVLAALLGGSAAAMWQAHEAQEKREEAVGAARRAEDQRIETQRALDDVQAERARQREIARKVWLEISPRFAEEGGSVAARRALVDLCEGVYRDLAREAAPEDVAFWREYASGRLRSGTLLRGARGAGVGDYRRALEEYGDASRRFEALATQDAADIQSAVGWIRADVARADVLQVSLQQVAEARVIAQAAAERARELLGRSREAELVDAAGDAFQTLGDVESKLEPAADAMARARPLWDESAALRSERLGADPQAEDPALDEARRRFASSLVRRAVRENRAEAGAAGLQRALLALDEAEGFLRPMFARDPGEPRSRRSLATTLAARADILRKRERHKDAEAPLVEAIDLLVPLLGDAADADVRQTLAELRTWHGMILRSLKRLDEAHAVLLAADAEAARQLSRVPEEAVRQQRSAAAAMVLGEVRLMLDRADAREPLARAVRLYRGFGPDRLDFRPSLAKSLVLLGDAEWRSELRDAARSSYREAIPLLEAMAGDPQADPEVKELLDRAQSRT